MNAYNYRPITFEGRTFAPSVMGISVLEGLVPGMTEETGDWIWRLPICCGMAKSTGARRSHRCAIETLDLMLEHRVKVVAGIRERFSDLDLDLDPEAIYAEWALALQTIIDLSAGRDDDCHWSAPVHPDDPYQTKEDFDRFLNAVLLARPDGGVGVGVGGDDDDKV